jgi:HEAT repeat protein
MVQNVPFKTVIEALLDESAPFPARYLHRFSDLEPADLQSLLQAWPEVALRRKENLLEDLNDLSESDTLTYFDSLARELLNDPDASVRTQAIHLLWECEDPKLARLFIEFLAGDENVEVRAAAASALGRFVYLGELDKIPVELKEKVEECLLAASQANEPDQIRRRALESLGHSGRPEVQELIEAAYHQKSLDWKVSAVNAMGRSSDSRWAKAVLSQLRAPDEELRAEAVQAAGELDLHRARPILLELLEDEEDPAIRRHIVWALSQLGGEGVRSRLEELVKMETDDEEVEFLEEALDNLSFTEDLSQFELFSLEPGDSEQDE